METDIAEDMTKSALEIASTITDKINIITEEVLTETRVTTTTTMLVAIIEEARVGMMIKPTRMVTEVAEEATTATIARTERKEEAIRMMADTVEVGVAISIVTVVAPGGTSTILRAASTRKIDPEATGIIMTGKVELTIKMALALVNIHSMKGLAIGETAAAATDLLIIKLAAS